MQPYGTAFCDIIIGKCRLQDEDRSFKPLCHEDAKSSWRSRSTWFVVFDVLCAYGLLAHRLLADVRLLIILNLKNIFKINFL